MPDKEQLEQFKQAVEEKNEAAEAAEIQGDQDNLEDAGTPPDVQSVRAKSSRKGQVTADKWNQ